MSLSQTTEMVSRVRIKLMRDSCKRNAKLQSLVVQANLLDRLLDDIQNQLQVKTVHTTHKIQFDHPHTLPDTVPELTPAGINDKSTSVTEYQIFSDSSDDDDDDAYSFEYIFSNATSIQEPHTPLIQSHHRQQYSNMRQKLGSANPGVVVFADSASELQLFEHNNATSIPIA